MHATTQGYPNSESADNKAFFFCPQNPLRASKNLQSHLHELKSWYRNWKVKINKNKSWYINITLKHGIHI